MTSKSAEMKPRVPKMKATPGGSTYVRPGEIEWSPTQFDKVWIKVLYEDKAKGEMTSMVKLEPGAYVPMHIHPEIEQALVLEGSMTDHDGTACAGDYVWRRPGSTHETHSKDGAVMFAVYRKPNIFQYSRGLKASRRQG